MAQANMPAVLDVMDLMASVHARAVFKGVNRELAAAAGEYVIDPYTTHKNG
jgi:hypothetical protein